MSNSSAWVRALAALACLAAAIAVGLSWTFPPAAVPRDASEEEFSAERARVHLEAMAQRPHPLGSAESTRVREYVAEQLRALGLTVEVQEALSTRMRSRPARFAIVRNVLARLRANEPGGGKALILMAHYDSRGMTPGASDDGYGVAALLETARALTVKRPAEGGDILLVITDGEEEGLLGAHAFVESHPWAAEAGAVLNFEARGNAGPVLMFQTGEENAALIDALSHVAPGAAASSLTQAVYRRMPNDTDLSEWLPHTPALNFANIGGFERYHAATDTVANADLRTLQHHGSYALRLARHLGGRSLPLPREGDATYFDVGPVLVHYPARFDWPLLLGAAALTVVFLALGRRFRALRLVFAGLGVLVVVATAIVAGAASGLLWALAVRIHPAYALMEAASAGLKQLHFASFLAVGVAAGAGAQAALSRWLRPAEIHAGALVVLCALAALTATALPGAAFLFTWPVLVALPFAMALAWRSAGEPRTPQTLALAVAASVPALILVVPILPLLFGAFGPVGGPVHAGLAALLTASAAPAVRAILAPAPRAIALATVGIAAAFTLAANLRTPFDRDHPRPDTVFFAVDADRGRAFWMTPDPEPPPWAATAMAGATREARPLPIPLAPVLAAPAPSVGERGPEIAWLADAPADGGRAIHARVVPPPGAELLEVHVEGVTSAQVAGRAVPVNGNELAFRFYAPPPDGVEIDWTSAGKGPAVVRAVSQREGFPAEVAGALAARPPDRMAKPGMMPPWDGLLESDRTIVARSWTK